MQLCVTFYFSQSLLYFYRITLFALPLKIFSVHPTHPRKYIYISIRHLFLYLFGHAPDDVNLYSLLMKLEEAIQQKRPFRNEYHKMMVNLLYTNNWLEEKTRDFLKSQNISLQQYNILRILRGSAVPLSTMQIRERMLDRMSDTSRIIDRMVIKGIVEKKQNGNDKRLVDITITEKGLQVLKDLDEQNNKLEGIVKSLSQDEAKMLNDLLEKVRSNY